MDISKTQILGFLFFLVNCPNIFAKPATPARKDLGELNASIFELQEISSYTWRTMVSACCIMALVLVKRGLKLRVDESCQARTVRHGIFSTFVENDMCWWELISINSHRYLNHAPKSWWGLINWYQCRRVGSQTWAREATVTLINSRPCLLHWAMGKDST